MCFRSIRTWLCLRRRCSKVGQAGSLDVSRAASLTASGDISKASSRRYKLGGQARIKTCPVVLLVLFAVLVQPGGSVPFACTDRLCRGRQLAMLSRLLRAAAALHAPHLLQSKCVFMRRPGAGPDESAAEVEVLKGRLTDAATKNKKLLALVHQQHSQIQVPFNQLTCPLLICCWLSGHTANS